MRLVGEDVSPLRGTQNEEGLLRRGSADRAPVRSEDHPRGPGRGLGSDDRALPLRVREGPVRLGRFAEGLRVSAKTDGEGFPPPLGGRGRLKISLELWGSLGDRIGEVQKGCRLTLPSICTFPTEESRNFLRSPQPAGPPRHVRAARRAWKARNSFCQKGKGVEGSMFVVLVVHLQRGTRFRAEASDRAWEGVWGRRRDLKPRELFDQRGVPEMCSENGLHIV